ncbi:MAG: hypothetical protein ACUVSV_06680 [Armatimonadota bacterium]
MISKERLRELIAHGEPPAVEFKGEEQGLLSDNELVEMVGCPANRPGEDMGYLLVGVEDEARWQDLDPLEFERFRRFIRETKQGDRSLLELPDIELAKALGAVEANHEVTAIRVLGLLLFGKEESLRRLLPTHEVAFQVLAGTQVLVNDFFLWPLLRVMEEILTRFRARYREEEVMLGLFRIGVPEYSERAFREAVANALVHRDYTLLGAVHNPVARGAHRTTSPQQLIAAWEKNLPMCASEALNPSSRSRWYYSTCRNTERLPVDK